MNKLLLYKVTSNLPIISLINKEENHGNSTQPIRLLFLQATHNPSAATFFTCWLMVIYYGATLSCLAATGRQTWAFARDHGLPFSSWMGVIHSTLKCRSMQPLHALLLYLSTV